MCRQTFCKNSLSQCIICVILLLIQERIMWKRDEKMGLLFKSTRGNETVTASQAILKGLADDGGLFVPTSIPKLDVTIEALSKMDYKETAYEVMKLFLTDFTEEELKNCINHAYDSKFDVEEIAPLVKADGAYFLELFHGATIALSLIHI